MSNKSKKGNAWLIEINDLQSARSAAHQGVGICAAIIIVSWIFVVILATTGAPVNYQLLIVMSIVYALIGMMIYRMSRLAAIGGLVLYLVERAVMIAQTGAGGGNIALIAIFTLAFVNSIRGTFAYHRMRDDRQAEISQVDGSEQIDALDKVNYANQYPD
jgi:hypothetical protein